MKLSGRSLGGNRLHGLGSHLMDRERKSSRRSLGDNRSLGWGNMTDTWFSAQGEGVFGEIIGINKHIGRCKLTFTWFSGQGVELLRKSLGGSR